VTIHSKNLHSAKLVSGEFICVIHVVGWLVYVGINMTKFWNCFRSGKVWMLWKQVGSCWVLLILRILTQEPSEETFVSKLAG